MHPRAHAPQQEEPLRQEALEMPLKSSPHSLQLEKSLHSNEDPSTAKNKYIIKKIIPTNVLSAQSLQSCLTPYNSVNNSPPGSSVHGILQARI